MKKIKPCDQNKVAPPEYMAANIKDVRLVCEYILKEHEALQNLIAGWGKIEPCPCNICQASRRLMGE